MAPRPSRPAPRYTYRASRYIPRFAANRSLNGYGQSACLFNSSYANSFYCRQFFPRSRFYGAAPVVFPYWIPFGSYDSDQGAQPAPEANDQLAGQIADLASEVEMLRQEQMERAAAAPPTVPAPAEEKPVPTLLVFRDGRRAEIQNYAIVGQTLWVFTAQSSRRIALAELDPAATRQSNEDRGVDFSLPDTP